MRLKQLFFYLGVVALVQGCSSLQLAPIVEHSTGHYQQGQIIWHDCVTSDLEKNMQFYHDLLGWSFDRQGDYVVVLNNGTPIAGMLEHKPQEGEDKGGGWLSYMSMRDVDETVSWVKGSGGDVLKGPDYMQNRGQYAMIAGPQDEPLMLLDLENGDPLAKAVPVGGWLWLELWAHDVEQALDFYQQLGDYSAEKTGGKGEDYWVLIDSDERWQAGITAAPFDDIPAQWVPVIRVKNPAEIVGKVEQLGGRVIIKPGHPLTDSNVALVQDPTGGIFMVESWSPQSESEQ